MHFVVFAVLLRDPSVAVVVHSSEGGREGGEEGKEEDEVEESGYFNKRLRSGEATLTLLTCFVCRNYDYYYNYYDWEFVTKASHSRR